MPFEAGERVLLVDGRGRRYLVRLQEGATFHFHGGRVAHDAVIGSPEGTEVASTTGSKLICLRPTMADFVLEMPRGAQVVYPKDAGAILVAADVGPGVRVLEAGTGSGSLTLALARAAGAGGRVVSYEIREDHFRTACANVEAFFGRVPPWVELRQGDVADVADRDEIFDRVILDLPEPWTLLDVIRRALPPGGIVCCYLPTTNQTQDTVLALGRSGFTRVETFEIMLRTWHVTERSVRPDHRMVAHTGFITTARRSPDRG
jgi:tRNA (adenine57-N1/adenine58-N1)-methyltransferase